MNQVEQAEAMREIIENNLATKQDIKELRAELGLLEERLTYKLTIRLGLMLAAAVTIIAAIVKL